MGPGECGWWKKICVGGRGLQGNGQVIREYELG